MASSVTTSQSSSKRSTSSLSDCDASSPSAIDVKDAIDNTEEGDTSPSTDSVAHSIKSLIVGETSTETEDSSLIASELESSYNSEYDSSSELIASSIAVSNAFSETSSMFSINAQTEDEDVPTGAVNVDCDDGQPMKATLGDDVADADLDNSPVALTPATVFKSENEPDGLGEVSTTTLANDQPIATEETLIKTLEDAINASMASVEIDFRDLGIIEAVEDSMANTSQKKADINLSDSLGASSLQTDKDQAPDVLSDDSSDLPHGFLDDEVLAKLAKKYSKDRPWEKVSDRYAERYANRFAHFADKEPKIDKKKMEAEEVEPVEVDSSSLSDNYYDPRENSSSDEDESRSLLRAAAILRAKPNFHSTEASLELSEQEPKMLPDSTSDIGLQQQSSNSSLSHIPGHGSRSASTKPPHHATDETHSPSGSMEAASSSDSHDAQATTHYPSYSFANEESFRQWQAWQWQSQAAASLGYSSSRGGYGPYQSYQTQHHQGHLQQTRPYHIDARVRTSQYYPESRINRRSSDPAFWPREGSTAAFQAPFFNSHPTYRGYYQQKSQSANNHSYNGRSRSGPRYSDSRSFSRGRQAGAANGSRSSSTQQVQKQPNQKSAKGQQIPSSEPEKQSLSGSASPWFEFQDSSSTSSRLESRPSARGGGRGGGSRGGQGTRYADRHRPMKQWQWSV